jgi:hypothetical protein
MNNLGLRFGKLPPRRDYRTFLFSNYVKDDIPAPPESIDSTTRVYKNLNMPSPTYLFPMDANDELGNCTVVAMAHGDTVWSGLVGNLSIYPVDLIKKIYFHLTGGDDTGLALLTVLDYFRRNLVMNERLYAYISINPYNHTHVKQAIMLFGGLLAGFQVQENCMEDFKNSVVWTPGTLINAGHAIFVTGYNESEVNLLTWGSTHRGTWAWWDECVDELYAILPPEASNPLFTPGFDFDKLKKDLVSVSEWI